MKKRMMFFVALLLSACASLIDSRDKPQLFEEKLAGEHATLAACVAGKLQSDGRSFMRMLQIRNRHYPDLETSEIHAYDTRYLHNVYAAYAPSNPDGILFYGEPVAEVSSAAQRAENDRSIYAFVLTLRKSDDKTVNATLKGEPFTGKIAWQILQRCTTSTNQP